MADSLLQRQQQFTEAVAGLLLKAFSLGFGITLGDAYRDPRCPYGSMSSKHHRRLAIDLNLFKDGTYLRDTSDHAQLGSYWESIGGIWGGHIGDGNHYAWPAYDGDTAP